MFMFGVLPWQVSKFFIPRLFMLMTVDSIILWPSELLCMGCLFCSDGRSNSMHVYWRCRTFLTQWTRSLLPYPSAHGPTLTCEWNHPLIILHHGEVRWLKDRVSCLPLRVALQGVGRGLLHQCIPYKEHARKQHQAGLKSAHYLMSREFIRPLHRGLLHQHIPCRGSRWQLDMVLGKWPFGLKICLWARGSQPMM